MEVQLILFPPSVVVTFPLSRPSRPCPGHYTAYVRIPCTCTADGSEDAWLYCNDMSVTPATAADVVSRRCGRICHFNMSDASPTYPVLRSVCRAYVLFYKRRHLSTHNSVKYASFEW